MAEHIRNCAGGVVFAGDEVFLLKNDKGEWIMPKGVIRDRNSARDVALYRVEAEAGIRAEIVAPVGRTSYDFFSQSRRKSVSNRIQWYAMRASDRRYRIAFEQGFLDGDYYPYEIAVRLLTHEQDRDILRRARQILADAEAPQP
ncbi:MAG TPA: NUDIX domain-containing protein [Candidatus Pullichristensenella avicola]|nr:NUDIX domain-containing protein [Candidatus Pullichristensenella avicola]